MSVHSSFHRLTSHGWANRLMPAKYIKPFLKGHKNDYRDAEAIAEAVQRPTMRFVPFKSDEQLDLQALHRVRSRLVGQRTAVINQIRAFLLEHGIAVRQGPGSLRQALPSILARRTDVLSPRITHLIEDLTDDWRRFDQRIADVTREIEELAKQDEHCKGLMGVPGVGPITASAMVAAIGDGAAFSKGRDFAAWLGLVPKQISTGDRTILGGISRRGNRYLCTLFIQGARSVLQRSDGWEKKVSAAGWSRHPRDCIKTSLLWRWPTSSLGLPGRCSITHADTTLRSSQKRHNSRRCQAEGS